MSNLVPHLAALSVRQDSLVLPQLFSSHIKAHHKLHHPIHVFSMLMNFSLGLGQDLKVPSVKGTCGGWQRFCAYCHYCHDETQSQPHLYSVEFGGMNGAGFLPTFYIFSSNVELFYFIQASPAAHQLGLIELGDGCYSCILQWHIYRKENEEGRY